MAKLIKYKLLAVEVNNGTKENPIMEQIFQGKIIECRTQTEYDNNYPIAEKEAVGEIIVEGEFEDIIEEPTELETLDARLTYVEMMTGLLEV